MAVHHRIRYICDRCDYCVELPPYPELPPPAPRPGTPHITWGSAAARAPQAVRLPEGWLNLPPVHPKGVAVQLCTTCVEDYQEMLGRFLEPPEDDDDTEE